MASRKLAGERAQWNRTIQLQQDGDDCVAAGGWLLFTSEKRKPKDQQVNQDVAQRTSAR